MPKEGRKCPEHLKRAIIELSEIIRFDEEKTCSLDKVGKIEGFYEQYLDTSSKTQPKSPSLPKWLKKFFLSYIP